jgi:hypothetical protein
MNMNAQQFANKLSARSQSLAYDVHKYFDWPDQLPTDAFWIGPELTTVYGTEYCARASETTLKRLSQAETVNLFSIFAHGESALLQTLMKSWLRPELAEFFRYLTHFADEETKHTCFFVEFCVRYGGGVLPSRTLTLPSTFPPDVERMLGFLRILVFEEIGDYFNVRALDDQRLPELVRRVHQRHHLDEVGHIAVGWRIAAHLLASLGDVPQSTLETAKRHIESYMLSSVQGFYNPDMYRRAGFEDPFGVHAALLEHPARAAANDAILTRARRRLHALWTRGTGEESGQEDKGEMNDVK